MTPTDCLAACLKEALPDAQRLALGFDTGSGLSTGTAKTSVEGLKFGGKIRENGRLRDVPLGYKRRDIDFGRGLRHAVTIPWGDVATATTAPASRTSRSTCRRRRCWPWACA